MGADHGARLSAPRPIAIAGTTIRELAGAWSVARTSAGAASDPAAMRSTIDAHAWYGATVPGTVASTLIAAKEWDWDSSADIDADDWWYRCEFVLPADAPGPCHVLRFDGLATIADVWLNDEQVLWSDNMWLSHETDVTRLMKPANTLLIRFASLQTAMTRKRPRPRWRTRVVEQQQLRWWRTSWLGRMSGWTPATPVIGPWRGVFLESRATRLHDDFVVTPSVDGNTGTVDSLVQIANASARGSINRATLRCAGHEVNLTVNVQNEITTLTGILEVPGVERWWPHTHGASPLYDVVLTVETNAGASSTSLGKIGFRAVEVDHGTDGKGFALRINGVRCFARGTCWSPIDIASLGGDDTALRDALLQVRDAGFNMLRLSGTMAYESETFHNICDELGIMVWQDFMFANMDYPADDETFANGVRAEAAQIVRRLQHRPSMMVLCGGSEVFQQAAMLGFGSDSWQRSLFTDLLPEMCSQWAPHIAYVENSPAGGPLPFAANEGISHYYGVGAYLRPLEDARRANVRFTTECLGFANVPEPRTIDLVATPSDAVPHHPRWKRRVPRDRGTGWDFDDIRDHYFRVLFEIDPLQARYADVERYLAMSRVVSGEVMARTMAEWRRSGSECAGALVWMHRDLWPGAGWGIVDSTGLPKAAYWYLARACAPVALLLTDEGVNGLTLHTVNDGAQTIDADLHIALWNGKLLVAEGNEAVTLIPHSASTFSADAILERFTDVNYAYRFGPAGHDVVVATLRESGTGRPISESHHFPAGLRSIQTDPGLTAVATQTERGEWRVTVRCESTAIAVAVDIDGFVPSDSYFHMSPGSSKEVRLRACSADASPSGTFTPLNARQPTRVIVGSAADQRPLV